MNASEAREKAENLLREVTSQVEELRKRRDSLNRIHIETTNINLRRLFHREIETLLNKMRAQINPSIASTGLVLSVSVTPTDSHLIWGIGLTDQERTDMENMGRRCVEYPQFEAIIKKVIELVWKGHLDQYLQTYRIGAVQQVIYESLPTGGLIWKEMLKSIPELQYETPQMAPIPLPLPPPPQPNLADLFHPLAVYLGKTIGDVLRGELERRIPQPEPKPPGKWVAMKVQMPRLEDLPRGTIVKDESSPKPQPDKKEKEDSANKEKT